ncbi:uncharacterized protein F4817DRAFT_314059 [Daldinia loculata]|uniref:uncharacterized protein n=1 Tax=Daldinia loculata TaxID=103429 RepID=UPI0020C28DCD|nr:uncharacterized protein F4817DRAFT_314059 [Daldinia loculata]KAI1649121.1 hypothetical protein F4817DRAFT_314059 [Daldinia loculata]
MPPKRSGAPRKVAASSSRAKKRANEGPPEGVNPNQDQNGGRAKRQKVGPKEPNTNNNGGRAKRQTQASKKSDDPEDPDDFEDSENDEYYEDDEDTGSDPSNGLDQSLPPVSNVYAAFQDIARRSHDLLNDNSRIHLRVATMCSGTDAPIFALKMLEESFDRMQLGRQFLKFSHIFSAEIDPVKQAYIARNTEGAIIFKDVRDFIEPKDLKAPTAMGAMEKIPGDIDLLVAGCSCLDFSTLNSQKRKDYSEDVITTGKKLMDYIEKNGEGNGYDESHFEVVNDGFNRLLMNINNMGTSGQTFFSMLKYVKDRRPKVVILENVMGAPWKNTADIWFPFVGYKAAFVKADTKNFYIPQTRNRGYLVAVDRGVFEGKIADDIIDRWSSLMTRDLVRRASTPINSWLLPSAHPLTERARQDDSEKALAPVSKPADWERSKARHLLVREKEGLGESHPLTNWSLSQPGQLYDRMDRLVTLTQPKRVLDCIDINHLRALKKGYDSRFKNRIHDLSQNVDRTHINTPFGITGCITPNGIHWVTDQCRILSGFEMLGLQGLPLNRLEFATETQEDLRSLAGNAMSTTVVGAAMVAVLRAIQESSRSLNDVFPVPLKKTQVKIDRQVIDSKLEEFPSFSTMTVRSFQMSSLTELLGRCRRYCFCNGSAKYSTDDFLECTICSTIRCKWCAGNPPHSFAPTKRPSNFLLLGEVEQEVMQFLPSVITDLVAVEYLVPTNLAPRTAITAYPSIMKHLAHTTFYYQSTHVTEVVTSAYGEEFREQLGLDHIRLGQPIAKATIHEDALSILPTPASWKFWRFKSERLQVEIMKTGGTLQVMAINVENPLALPADLQEDLYAACGKYYHQPDCDAPENSLHVLDGRKLFFFKESTRTGTPDRDGYIISEECRLLESHEYREVLLKFKACVDLQKLDPGKGTLDARVDGFWVSSQAINHGLSSTIASHKRLECFKVPNSKRFIIREEDPEQQILAEALFTKDKHCDQYGIINKYESLSGITGNWVTVEKLELPQFHDFVSHINVKLASLGCLEVNFEIVDIDSWIKALEDWRTRVDVQDSPFGQLPRAQWLKVSFKAGAKRKVGTRWIQHHHSDAMAAFESHAKKQIPPFEVRVKVHPTLLEDVQLGYEGQFVAAVQYLINHKTLGRTAAAYLPPTKSSTAKLTAYTRVERNAILSENMQVNSGSGKHSFVPFRESLKSLAEFPLPADIQMKMSIKMKSFGTKLSKSQSRSLGWTLWREICEPEFTEREIEEEIVPDLKLRLIGCAERKACHNGGILADDVGYGKTIIMLALMHCQEEFDKTVSSQLRTTKNPCRMHLNASLVLVPSHLVDQWADEAGKFLLIKSTEIVKIKGLGDLKDTAAWGTLNKLQKARLVIVNVACIANIEYYENLAKLAGSLNPPCVRDNFRKGSSAVPLQSRAFEDWYEDAASAAGDYAGKLLRLCTTNYSDGKLMALYHEIEGRRNAHRKVYQDFSKNYESSVINSAMPVQPEASQRFNSPWEMIPSKPTKFTHVLEAFTFARVVYDEFSYEGFPSTLFVANSQAHSKWVLSATPPTRDLAAICYTAKHFNVHVARPIHRRQGMPRITHGPELEDRSNAEDLQLLKFSSDQTIRERHQQGMKFLEHFATSNPLDQDLSGGIEVEEKVVVCEMSPYEFVHYHDLEQDLRAHNFDANMLPRESRVFLQPLVGDEWGADGKQVGTSALIHRSSQGNWHRGEYSTSCLIEQRRSVRLNALRVFRITAEKAIWLSKRIWDNEKEKNFVNGRNATTDIYMLLRDIWRKDLAECGGLDAWRELSREIVIKKGMQYEEMVKAVETSHPDFCMSEERFFNALNTLTSNTWIDYYHLKFDDLKAIDEQEATALLQDLSRVNNGEGIDLMGGDVKTALSILVEEGQGQYMRPKETIKSLETRVTNEQVDAAKNKPGLESLCRAAGLSFKTSAKKSDLTTLLKSYVKGELEESNYVGYLKCGAMKIYRYPLIGGMTKIRGGKYTFTGNDVSNTSIELRKTFEKVIYAIRQERITKNLMSDKKEMNCDLCGQMVPREELHIVCECGHLLCKKHLNSVHCGGDDSERCSSLLKDATMSLKMVNNPQRRLDLGVGTQKDAPCPKISSKFQMLANTAKAIPAGEFGLVFFQYNSQLEQLKHTLRKNGIGFFHLTDSEAKSLSKMDDQMRPLRKLHNLKRSDLHNRCDERGLQWSDKESDEELRGKINGWKKQFGNSVKHPKLRILQINDVTSAGSNFQYANHVMFISPFVVELQENYDSCMKQAIGRCVRYGQKKTVQVYHFVTANTIEVDILELRTKSHVLVRPGKAIGRLRPAPPVGNGMKDHSLARTGEDTLMSDAPGTSQPGNDDSDITMPDHIEASDTSDNLDGEERIGSNLTTQDIWKAMNEQNWLTTVGIEY